MTRPGTRPGPPPLRTYLGRKESERWHPVALEPAREPRLLGFPEPDEESRYQAATRMHARQLSCPDPDCSMQDEHEAARRSHLAVERNLERMKGLRP